MFIRFLETEKPSAPTRVQLVRAATDTLEVCWGNVPTADNYLLQIQKYDLPASQQTNQTGSPGQHPPGIPLAKTPPTPLSPVQTSPKITKLVQQPVIKLPQTKAQLPGEIQLTSGSSTITVLR